MTKPRIYPLYTSPSDAPNEEWRTIDEHYYGAYAVSSLGRIRHNIDSAWHEAGDLVSVRDGKERGPVVSLSRDGRQVNTYVKELMVSAFNIIGNQSTYFKDSNPKNCTLENITTEKPSVAEQEPDLPNEIWKPLLGSRFTGTYEISNYGRVKVVKATGRCGPGKIIKSRLKRGTTRRIALGVGRGTQIDYTISLLFHASFGDYAVMLKCE